MKERKTMPKHSEIMDYWKDKCITEKGEVRDKHKVGHEINIPIIEDWGEPTCWCCGKDIDIYDIKSYVQLLDDDFKKIWEFAKVKTHLHRCHIVPRALGGTNNANNLFLMCNKCHEDSPDFVDPKYFFIYIYKKRNSHINGIEMKSILDKILNLADECGKNLETFDTNKLQQVINEKANTHMYRMSESTIIASIVDSLEDIKRK